MPDRLAFRLLLAAASGTVVATGFEPLALWWAMPFGVGGLFVAAWRTGLWRAAWCGLAFGISFFGINMAWLDAVGRAPYLGNLALQTSFAVPLACALTLASRSRAWPLWFPGIFASLEWLRTHFPFGGMPFGRLAFASIDSPYAAVLPYAGIDAATWLIAAGGVACVWCLPSARRATSRVALGSVAALVVAGLLLPALLPYQVTAMSSVQVGVVQGEVPGDGTNVLYDADAMTASFERGSRELVASVDAGETPAPAFVVWPENATARDPFRHDEINGYLTRAVTELGVPVLVGAMVDPAQPDAVLNQGIVWDPVTGPGERYTKRHPVPFGEYIPYRGAAFFEQFAQLDEIPRDMVSGVPRGPLSIADVRIADAICFDVAFDDVLSQQALAGAELLVVQTSNAKFLFTSQQRQQFAISRVQAVVNGRWMVVASMNGVTGFIGPDGRIIQELPVRDGGFAVAEVGLTDAQTPAQRFSNWATMFSAFSAMLGILFGLAAYAGRGRARGASDRDQVGAPSFLSQRPSQESGA